jgi:hypothetical protein
MGRFSDRLSKEGITWIQFLFQFVIIVLGVYLAIFFERKAGERELEEDTRVMLQNVLTELEQDEAEILEKLETQAVRLETARALGEVLARAEAVDGPAVDSLVEHFLLNNRTAFLRESAYQTMVAGGYLRSLVRTELPRLFADLYERTYTRVVVAGEWQDYQVFEYMIPSYNDHVVRGEGRFLRPGPEANVRFRNRVLQLHRGIGFYQGFLEDTLQEVRRVKGAVQRYLEEEG